MTQSETHIPSPKRALERLVIFTVITALAFVVAELGARGIEMLQPQQFDPYLGKRPIVKVGTDALGYRNGSVLATATIVTLGDSYTAGKSVRREQSWPSVLEKLSGVPVYNMAVEGYSLVQSAALLPAALERNPEVVVVGFNMAKDLSQAETFACGHPYWKVLCAPEFVRDQGSTSNRPRYERAKKLLITHSRALARFGELTRGLRSFVRTGVERERKERVIPVAEHDIETTLKPDEYATVLDLSLPTTREGWRIAREVLTTMRSMVEDSGAQFVVLIIPNKEDVYLAYFEDTGKGIPADLRDYERMSKAAWGEVEAFCVAESLRCVSPVSKLTEALTQGVAPYRQVDDHYVSGIGYALVAEAAFEYLAEDGIALVTVARPE